MDISDLATKSDLALIQREISLLREAVLSEKKIIASKLLTPQEVCALLKISLNTLKTMRQKKQIKFKKLGKSIYRYPSDQFN